MGNFDFSVLKQGQLCKSTTYPLPLCFLSQSDQQHCSFSSLFSLTISHHPPLPPSPTTIPVGYHYHRPCHRRRPFNSFTTTNDFTTVRITTAESPLRKRSPDPLRTRTRENWARSIITAIHPFRTHRKVWQIKKNTKPMTMYGVSERSDDAGGDILFSFTSPEIWRSNHAFPDPFRRRRPIPILISHIFEISLC